MKNMECTSSQLLNVTLLGKDAPPFIGMLPLLNVFSDLEEALSDGSQFLSDVNATLINTEEIDTAVTFATANLELFRDMMRNSANQRPTNASNADLLHTCELCTAIAPRVDGSISALQGGASNANFRHTCEVCTAITPRVDNSISALQGGLAEALQAARAEVQAQIAPSKRTDLRSAISQTADPIRNVKDSLRDCMEWFIDDDKFGQVIDAMDGDTPYVLLGVLIISFLAGLLIFCACTGMILFIVREEAGDAAGRNPYSRSVHRCAGCTWCCAFLYTALAFLLGGFAIVVTFLLSSMCLIMDDLDGPMTRDIAPALGIESNDNDNFNMVVDIIHNCITVKDPLAAGNLLDILYVTENGQKVTMQTKVQKQTKELIDNQFNLIDLRAGQTMKGNPSVVQMKDILRHQDVDSMILPDVPTMRVDARYSALNPPSNLSDAFVTSTKCADDNVTQGLHGVGNTVKGIDSFVTTLHTFGTGVASGTCARNVICRNPSDAECQAGNNLIDVKRELLTMNRYRCDLFEDPSNPFTVCDPINMQGSGSGPYTGDCIFTSGAPLRRKQVDCNLAKFVTYVNDWSIRFEKVFQRVDDSAQTTLSSINATLRNLVDQNLVSPISKIQEGANCGFVSQTYRGVVDGLCYQGVWGLHAIGNSYLVLAILSAILIVVMYILWRRSLDNVNSWGKSNP